MQAEKLDPITRNFHDTVVARAKSDPEFRNALFAEALHSSIEGEIAPGLITLLDCINGTREYGS
jgi:hypothetical protein